MTYGGRARVIEIEVTDTVVDVHDQVVRAAPLQQLAYVEAMRRAVVAVGAVFGAVFGTLPAEAQPRRIALRSLVSEGHVKELVMAAPTTTMH